MALRLRRGTDAERASITFQQGELVYVTDTKEIYVGDGTTLGGVLVTADVANSPAALTRNLDLDSYTINGTGNININGTVTANFLVGDGSGLTNLPSGGGGGTGVIEGQEYVIGIQGSLRGSDSSVIVDHTTNTITGNFVGDGSLISDLTLNQLDDVITFAPNEGEVLKYVGGNWVNFPENGITEGSNYSINIVAGDSSTLVNAATGTITGTLSGPLTSDVVSYNTTYNMNNLNTGSLSNIYLNNTGETQVLKFRRTDSGTPTNTNIGVIAFDQIDDSGTKTYSQMSMWHYGIYIGNSFTGSFSDTNFIGIEDGNMAIGGYSPAVGYRLDVKGNAVITQGSLVFDDNRAYTDISTPATGLVMFDGLTADGDLYVYTGAQWTKVVSEQLTSGATILSTALLLGSLDNTARDAFGTDSSTIDGAVIYNTDADRVQMFQAGSWVNIPNNGTAIGEVLRWNGTEWAASVDPASGTTSNSDALGGQTPAFYLDWPNFTNTPTTLAGYGISDAATSAQGSLADSAIQPADLGNFTFTGSILDSSDSSAITITPAVIMSSDLTVQNSLVVSNKIVVDTLEVNNLITTPSAGTPEISSDGAILLTAGTRVEVTQSPFKMASFTTSERDLLLSENGDMIYNSDTNKFQGYANGTWVDLH